MNTEDRMRLRRFVRAFIKTIEDENLFHLSESTLNESWQIETSITIRELRELKRIVLGRGKR